MTKLEPITRTVENNKDAKAVKKEVKKKLNTQLTTKPFMVLKDLYGNGSKK